MPTPHATRTRRLARAATIVALAAVAALFTRPPIAFAGTYTVHTCQTPTGTFTGAGGWSSSSRTVGVGHDSGVATTCSAQTPGLRLEFGVAQLPVAPAGAVSWTFAAPTGTHINSISLFRTLQLGWPVVASRYARPYLYDVWHDDDVDENQVESELPPWSGDTAGVEFPPSLDVDRVWWGSISVRLSCWALVGSLDCGPFPAQVTISRAAIGLTDDEAPEGFATGGALAGSDPVRGVASLAVHATDSGGGVYRVALAVDGAEVARRVVDAAGGSCADVEPANDDPYEFGTSQPCPLAVDGSVQLDTATLRDGQHNVHATVEDAGGNTAVVFDGSVETHNAPINLGAPALSGDARAGGQLTAASGQWDGAPTGYDRRWLRCDADGAGCAPVAGAAGVTYALGDADAYHRMRVEVTAANGSGTAVARSAPSAVVADAAGRTAPLPPGSGSGGGTGGGSGSGGAGAGGGSGSTPDPGTGGIQGISNPLGQVPGHVANGSDAAAHARLDVSFQRADGRTARSISIPHGRRATLVGRLTDASGAGIGGARLGAAWRVPGHGWVARPGVRTGVDGRFVWVLAAGPSRDVRFTYFPYSDSHGAQLSNVVHADVLAPLSIRADPRRVSGSRVVRLSGRVGGGSIPRAGLLVTLEGYQRGWGWRAFRTVRTDRQGRWSTRYRFRLSRGRFGFRALVPHQGDFPYATSRSGGVYVVVS